MPEPASTVIGYIVDVQANVLTASLVEDDQGRAPTVTIGDEDILVGQIGSYVAIRQNDVNIVAIVTRMTEQEALAAPTIETPGEDTARLTFAKRIARLTPIGSIGASGQFDLGVGRYPTTGAEVHAMGSTDIAKMFERFQSKGFSVGTVATHPSLRVCLDPSNLFGRHFAILGQTGSGKSWTVAALVQRTVGHRGRIEWDRTKPDGTPRKLQDVSRLKTLGWAPKIPLADGLAATYRWFTAQGIERVRQVH